MIDKVTKITASDLSDIRIDYQDRLYILLGSYEQMEYKLTFIKKVISENISEYESALLDYRGKNLYVGSREEEPLEEDQTKDETAESMEETSQGAAKELQDDAAKTEGIPPEGEKIEET